VLGILTVAYALAYIDRQLLNLLVDPIKHSLNVSDTQLSLVQGLAFVSAYLLAGPLWGRAVDITNRRNILVLCICVWSISTALCGRADTYAGLFSARFGVGASEACIVPVCWSLISDLFSTQKRARAISIWSTGAFLGAGFSLVGGGLVISAARSLRLTFPVLETLATWQLAFVIVGIPGVLLAALLLLTVGEPLRRRATGTSTDEQIFTLREAMAYIWMHRGFYGRIFIAIGLIGVVMLGMPAWFPSFLIRYHGAAPASVGFKFGAVVVVCGLAGVLFAPRAVRIVQHWYRSDAPVRTAAFCITGVLLLCSAIPFAPGSTGALAVCAGVIFCFSIPVAILPVVAQRGTPNRLRGLVASLYSFFGNIIGFGIGPSAIALTTDKVFGNPRMVGYSIGIVCCIAAAIAAWLLFAVISRYRKMPDDADLTNQHRAPAPEITRNAPG